MRLAMIIYQQRDRAVKKQKERSGGPNERCHAKERKSGNDPLPAKWEGVKKEARRVDT